LQNGHSDDFKQLREIYSEIKNIYSDSFNEFILELKRNISDRIIPNFSSDIVEEYYLQIYDMTLPKRRHTLIKSSLNINPFLIDIILSYEFDFTGEISNIIESSHDITGLSFFRNLLLGYYQRGRISAWNLNGNLKYSTKTRSIEYFNIVPPNEIFTSGGSHLSMNVHNLKTGQNISTIKSMLESPHTYTVFEK